MSTILSGPWTPSRLMPKKSIMMQFIATWKNPTCVNWWVHHRQTSALWSTQSHWMLRSVLCGQIDSIPASCKPVAKWPMNQSRKTTTHWTTMKMGGYCLWIMGSSSLIPQSSLENMKALPCCMLVPVASSAGGDDMPGCMVLPSVLVIVGASVVGEETENLPVPPRPSSLGAPAPTSEASGLKVAAGDIRASWSLRVAPSLSAACCFWVTLGLTRWKVLVREPLMAS
mmetsp:Transcript_15563/g.45500  ORF Transcript_15563/g.45500 Transcript_15563/m.45500 type:complete len:227 (-) Transcript_15563:221-901(-)